MQGFLMTNIEEKNGEFSWKICVDTIDKFKHHISGFPSFDPKSYIYHGPTLVLKGSDSSFVKSSHVKQIQELFPRYILATQREAGHWLHVEKPEAVVDKISQFIKYSESTVQYV
jgi:pimeloyl-ACP methyl ester carboxylesterase